MNFEFTYLLKVTVMEMNLHIYLFNLCERLFLKKKTGRRWHKRTHTHMFSLHDIKQDIPKGNVAQLSVFVQ